MRSGSLLGGDPSSTSGGEGEGEGDVLSSAVTLCLRVLEDDISLLVGCALCGASRVLARARRDRFLTLCREDVSFVAIALAPTTINKPS